MKVITLKTSYFLFKNYCYLVIDPTSLDAIIIDPAWDMELITSKISEHNARLKAVLLTHSHQDHTHLALPLSRAHNIPILLSKTEIEYYSFKSALPIEQDSKLIIGSIEITPIFTPGHTRGSLCYLIDNALFTGDTLFSEGCGACIGPGASPYDMFETLQRLKKEIAPDVYIYPGHTYGKSVGQKFESVISSNIYLQFNNVADFVKFRMRKGQPNIFNFQ